MKMPLLTVSVRILYSEDERRRSRAFGKRMFTNYRQFLKYPCLFVLTALVIAFQNCQKQNFQTDRDSERAQNQQRELSRFVFQAVPAAAASSYSLLSAPKGVLFDSVTGELRWIPQRGQSGKHEIVLQQANGPEVVVPVTIAAISEADLQSGPPDKYADGDVGYIFIHGAVTADYCAFPDALKAYWGNTPAVVAPDASQRTVACYNGSSHIRVSAPAVAQQIVSAPCGRFNKCIVVTHSLGGLLTEFILLHGRAATSADLDQTLFASSAVYQQAKDRLLLVVSLASASGGSKVADILQDPAKFAVNQLLVGEIAATVGANQDSYVDLTVHNSTRVLAPIDQDPGVPFLMVAGFSTQVTTVSGLLSGSMRLFNGSLDLAFLDSVSKTAARGDGLVDFRSSCGVASDDVNGGAGYSVDLGLQFKYCASAAKKPNHYSWFATNLNHFLMAASTTECIDAVNPCTTYLHDSQSGTMLRAANYDKATPAEIIREALN
jgi:hypothetical protein